MEEKSIRCASENLRDAYTQSRTAPASKILRAGQESNKMQVSSHRRNARGSGIDSFLGDKVRQEVVAKRPSYKRPTFQQSCFD